MAMIQPGLFAYLVERQMLIATLINRAVCLAVAVLLFQAGVPRQAMAQVQFTTKENAFKQGRSAFKSRQYEIAVPALIFAAKHGVLRAKFYLAKVYSDNSGGWTDHGRAYRLLSEIVARHANVDPKDYRVAPIVGQALTSIARYERDGIKKANLPPSTRRALAFFNHAATYFGNEDAQFELAKHYLAGDGVEARVPYALNWLARLSKRGHAGAQAFLANLYWTGRHTKRDPVRALALITVAVENAREEDRFWIEDVHQNIFCEADPRTRLRVHQVVDGWRRRFGRSLAVSAEENRLLDLPGRTQRMCADGSIVGELVPSIPEAAPSTGTVEASTSGPASAAAGTGQTNQLSGFRSKQLSSGTSADTGKSKLRMSRIKPDRSDRRALNGFVLREGRNGTRNANEGRSNRRRRVVEPVQTKRRRKNNSFLNGFVLRNGSSTFGFSFGSGGD
jgi:exopolysaccharide production negative regulator